MKSVLRGVLACVLSFCVVLPSVASVVITNTRVIYEAGAREVTVQLSNKGQLPVLVSTWIDGGNAESRPNDAEVPFNITPPLFRLDPEKGQALRISLTQASMPLDRESVFWLNVHEVPPVSQEAVDGKNVMQLALRTRIKLFYRPKNLQGRVEDAPARLTWHLAPVSNAMVLRVKNPSAYHVSFASITLQVNGKPLSVVTDAAMVPPGGSHDFPITASRSTPAGSSKVQFEVINDFGGFSPYVGDVLP